MHRRLAARCLAAFVIVVAAASADEAGPAAVFLPARPVPDLTQTDPRGGFPDGGRKFCGPVAVSNSLMAIFGDDLEWEGVSHYDLVNRLASTGYMNTQVEFGTRVDQLMRGVERFLDDRNVDRYYLRFQGYRLHERRFSAGNRPPRLEWIQSALASGGAVWLNVGWYTVDTAKNKYRRMAGHWVTAVGYGTAADGTPNPAILVVHDPAPRAGTRPSREYVVLHRLDRGVMVGTTKNFRRSAHGIYRMDGGMHLKPGADCALLDGAVVLRLPAR